jgi:hypothetical protein
MRTITIGGNAKVNWQGKLYRPGDSLTLGDLDYALLLQSGISIIEKKEVTDNESTDKKKSTKQ